MILLLDNYDSFTFNLYDYLRSSGEEVKVVRNDIIDLPGIFQLNPTGVVISPGPCTPKEAGNLMDVLPEIIKAHTVLGVCLGYQAIGEIFGADLVEADKPVHGKLSAIRHSEHKMFSGVPNSFRVCRYHSLILENIKFPLHVTAKTQDGVAMALAHDSLPVWGIQYHPEAILTEYGKVLLDNWVDLTRKVSG